MNKGAKVGLLAGVLVVALVASGSAFGSTLTDQSAKALAYAAASGVRVAFAELKNQATSRLLINARVSSLDYSS
jgi:hypothetical protein